MDTVSFSLLPSEYFPPNSRFCAIEIGDFPRKFTNFSSFDKTSYNNSWFHPGAYVVQNVGVPNGGINWGLYLADITGDGKADFINHDKLSQRIYVHYYQLSTNSFRTYASNPNSATIEIYEHDIQFSDVNRDGTEDAIIINKRTGDVIAFPVRYNASSEQYAISSIGAIRGYTPAYLQGYRGARAPESPIRSIGALAWYDADHFSSTEPGYFADNRPDGNGGWYFSYTNPPTGATPPYRNATPLLGLYDSRNQSVIRQHAYWLRASGADGIILDLTNVQLDATGQNLDFAQASIDAFRRLLQVYNSMESVIPPKIVPAVRIESCVGATVTCDPNKGDTTQAQRVIDAVYSIINEDPRYSRLMYRMHDNTDKRDKPMLIVFHELTSLWKTSIPWSDSRFNIRYTNGNLAHDYAANGSNSPSSDWMYMKNDRPWWNFYDPIPNPNGAGYDSQGIYTNYRTLVKRMSGMPSVIEAGTAWVGMYQGENKWDSILYKPAFGPRANLTTFQRTSYHLKVRVPRLLIINRFNYFIAHPNQPQEGLSLYKSSNFEPTVGSDYGFNPLNDVTRTVYRDFRKLVQSGPGNAHILGVSCSGQATCLVSFMASLNPLEAKISSDASGANGAWQYVPESGVVSFQRSFGQTTAYIRLRNSFGESGATKFTF